MSGDRAVIIEGSSFGPPEVLTARWEDLPTPAAGEVRVRNEWAGVNFIDVLQRRGELGGSVPYRLGLEGAGIVDAVGSDVSDFSPGDRVAYIGGGLGAYSSARNVSVQRVIRLRSSVDTRTAASVLFKGLTADYLVHRLRKIERGDVVVVQAAAGGVGTLLTPLLKSIGARVVGTVGSDEKVKYAADLGCDAVVNYRKESVSGVVRDFTGGLGANIVFDSIGRDTVQDSLKAVGRFGLLVSYGWASGDCDPVAFGQLREQGSIFVTRPTVSHYVERRSDLEVGCERVFDCLEEGVYKAQIDAEIPIVDAASAHRRIESRRSSGSIILKV